MSPMKTVYKFPPYLPEEAVSMMAALGAHGFSPVSGPSPPEAGAEIALPEHEVPALMLLAKAAPAMFGNYLVEVS